MTSEQISDLIISLLKIFEPLEKTKSVDRLEAFLSEFGWIASISEGDLEGIQIVLGFSNDVSEIEDILAEFDSDDLSSVGENVIRLSELLKKVISDLSGLSPSSSERPSVYPFNQEAFWSTFPGELLDYLIYRYFEKYHPPIFGVLAFLGILTKSEIPAEQTTGRIVHFKREAKFELLPKIFTDFPGQFKDVYNWGPGEGAPFLSHLSLLQNTLVLLRGFGFETGLFPPSEELLNDYYDSDSEHREQVLEMQSYFVRYFDPMGPNIADVYLSAFPITPTGDNSAPPNGFMLAPVATGTTETEFDLGGDIRLVLKGGIGTEAGIRLEIRPGGVSIVVPPGFGTSINAEARVIKQTGNQGLKFEAIVFADGPVSSPDIGFEFGTEGLKLVISAPEDDGFLSKVLPSDPLELNFDLTLGFSKEKGFYIRGGAGLEYTFYINKSFGPIFINTVELMLEFDGDDIILIIAASGGAQIGPVTAAVQKIGLKTTLELGKRGLLGNTDLSLGFKPPSGVALFAKTSTVSFGGLLLVEDGNYAGLLYIDIKDRISITAVGILTTRMPDGSKIFSLKIIGMVEFPPIQLGYGFILTGVGLAIAIECCMNEEALRAGVYTGSLRSLFLSDPADNPMQLITDLQNFFPPTRDYHVFGFMAKLGWGGATSLIKADVGIFIEIGGPGRLALAGIAHAELPNEDAPKVILQLQVLGLLDLGDKSLSIDSSLTGSRLLDWPLDGDIIVRANWGDRRRFLTSAGGKFFPGYPIPPGVPPGMQLISVSLGSGNPRVGLFLYNAITENSVHFGASLQFHYHKDLGRIIGLIELDGGTSFDALFNFNPFYFKARMSAWFDLKRNGDRIMGVDVRLNLKGPNNYRAWGYARFEICGFDKEIEFDKKFGKKRPELPQSILSPREALEAELDEPKNWNILLPPRNACRVISCEDQQEELVDPFGSIRFSQKSVPLDLEIEKFGKAAIPADEDYFDILADDDMKTERVEEFFAPGEFVYLSNAEKISGPPFEEFKSGVEIAGAINMPDQSLREDIELEYETKFPGQSTYTPRLVLPVVLLNAQRIGGQKVHNKINTKPASETKAGITINNQKFTVVTSYATGDKFERVNYEKDGDIKEAGNFTYARARQMKDKIGTRDAEILDTEKAVSLS